MNENGSLSAISAKEKVSNASEELIALNNVLFIGSTYKIEKQTGI